MTVLIILLLIGLLLLSWQYILRLEPAGVFTLMWVVLIGVILGCQAFLIVRFTGLLFIIASVYSFTIGTVFGEALYHPQPLADMTILFNRERATWLMAVLFVAAFLNPVYTVILHGFSPTDIFSLPKLLQMNNTISIDRYYGDSMTTPLNQVLLVFSYTAPLFGGFCYRMVGRLGKTFSLLSVIPCVFVAFTQAMKMGLITSVFLWACGFLVCTYSYNLNLRIKRRTLFWLVGGTLLFFSTLFTSMVLRTGELSERMVDDITNKFFTYAFGYVPCFDIWFDSADVKELTYGAKTFYGISNSLGILERLTGIYQEWIPFGRNGFKGESNVYTVFRVMIEDFGPAPSCLILMLIGCLSGMITQNLRVKKNVCFNQIALSAIYAYVLWSFVTSFFAYNSYLVMFFVVYLLLRYVQNSGKVSLS